MLKLSIQWFESNYSSYTGMSSENIWISSGDAAQEKRKRRQNRVKLNLPQKLVLLKVSAPLNANVLCCRFFLKI